NYSSTQIAPANVVFFQIEALLREIADESTRETIACAGRIENRLEQVARHGEIRILAEQHGAVFAALDDQSVRTHAKNRAGGFPQIVVAGEHTRFGVVNQQEVPAADGGQQLFAEVLDPEIHGVAAGHTQLLHLRTDSALQPR